ncbi:unnamed protein product [Chondrus crispus]|uniref:TTI1 N-terminal TPR domain-containing protein n=1 Tax=Chondrus crispus TaxID=2769 RepID=R7QTL7_CHOCR|nr:unnamed protein product [Chondrus crispus]CDF40720.1 unnamed protein product [Chondrus crispus]|eukprot:XP_005711014.1 unnamed protein product [Chondrus crispus]
MPAPRSQAELSGLVSELATLPHTFAELHSATRNSSLVSLRESVRSRNLPASVRTLVLRTVSRLLGPSSPPENSSWTALPLWNEETLRSLFALLVDALDGDGFDAQENKLSQLPVTENHGGDRLSSFGKLMLTSEEQDALAAENSASESEEESLFPCVASIFPSPPEVPFSLQSALAASEQAQLAAAHVSHALAITGRHERAPAVRKAAFLALSALVRSMPEDLLAAFLPGLVSNMARVLQNSALDQAPILVAALDTLVSIVYGVFPPKEITHAAVNGHERSFAEALEEHRIRESPTGSAREGATGMAGVADTPHVEKSSRTSLLIARNASWSAAASREVSLRLRLFLESQTGPSCHNSVRARLAVARFVRISLMDTSSLSVDQRTRCLLIFALVELAGDEYPIIKNEALRAFKKLVKVGEVRLREIETCFKAVLTCVNRQDAFVIVGKARESDEVILGNDGSASKNIAECTIACLLKRKDETFRVKVCKGFLRIFLPSHDIQSERASFIVTPSDFAFSLVRVGISGFCEMLMSTHQVLWNESGDPEDQQFLKLSNVVLETSSQIGRAGLLSSIFTTLLSHGSKNEDGEEDPGSGESARRTDSFHFGSAFKSRAHAVLILQAAVRGAIARKEIPTNEMKEHVNHVMQCARDVLGTMTCFFLPAFEHDVSDGLTSVDDTMISLKHCILHCMSALIQDMSDMYERQLSKPLSSDVVLLVLISLLKDVSHGEKGIHNAAHTTLDKIGKTVRCSNARALLGRHLNYLISRVGRHLEERWAIDVLTFIIGTRGDAVSEEAILLLDSTLRDLNNNLAGAGNSRALKSLGAIESVLATAVRQSRTTTSQNKGTEPPAMYSSGKKESNSELHIAMLRKKLLYYCTDDMAYYHDLSAKEQTEAEMEEKLNEDNFVRNAFEQVALNTLDGMRDLLVGRPWNVRAAALGCATWAVYLLEDNQTELLPHAATILPLIPDQFAVLQGKLSKREGLLQRMNQRRLRGRENAEQVDELVKYLNGKGTELPVVIKACTLLSALAQCAGGFIRNRFVKLIYPKMRPLLRLASFFPTLLMSATMNSSGNPIPPPSYGAMSASDACLEAISSMANVLPESLAPHASSIVKYLAVYFDSRNDPRLNDKRNERHLNRSMIRHERERWEKRAQWAESIVLRLKEVNAGDVLTGLLCSDKSTPTTVQCRKASLHSTQVRSNRSVMP